MRRRTASLFLAVVLVACGADAPRIATSPPPAASPVVPSPVAAPAPALDASPTERTAEQLARDNARTPLANALLDAFSNFAPMFSPDGRKLLFGSRRDGNRQFYLSNVANPSAPPVLLTHGAERVGGATFSRDGRSVLFTRDSGADENYRISRSASTDRTRHA
jgi:hypothetical protein